MTPPPFKKRHLIYSYFIESTGIVEVFRALFGSYFLEDTFLKLNRDDGLILIEKLKKRIEIVFPRPVSKISPDLEELRYNAYWRMFGYTIKGKENFPKTANYNKEFNKLFEEIMYEIFQGILDKDNTIEKLSNPNTLAELLENLQKLLKNRDYNEIPDIASYWATAFNGLLELLEDDALMVDRLNILIDIWIPMFIYRISKYLFEGIEVSLYKECVKVGCLISMPSYKILLVRIRSFLIWFFIDIQ